MNKRLLGVLAFALIISATASGIIFKLISSRMVSAAGPPESRLLVASRDLPNGALVREIDVLEVGWRGSPPAHALNVRDQIVGRGVTSNIYAGEPFLDSRLAASGAGAGMAATIPQGMRAAAVRVNDVVGLAGFVTPGMRVDVLIMGHSPSSPSTTGPLSRTMLQNIQVLSAGQQIQKDSEGKPVQVQVVNLLVTPAQAEELSLANNDARIQLVLRNPLDKEEVKTSGAALTRLFGTPVAPERPVALWTPTKPKTPSAAPKAEPPETKQVVIPITIEVVHGSKKAEVKFKDPEAEKKPEAKKL